MKQDHTGFRSSVRKPLDLPCACRVAGGTTLELELLDLSMRGTRLKTSHFTPHVGDAIIFYLEGSEGYPGTVRSADGNIAGVEFDSELPPTVFERLLFKYACDTVMNASSEEPS